MLTHLIWHICYYKFDSNNIFVSNQSDSRERKEKINKLWIGLISFKILCLEILPSGQNKTYLWKMTMELGMFSLPHESLPCHGQRKSVPHLKPLRLQDLLPCLERILHWKLKSLKALKVKLKTITNIASCMLYTSNHWPGEHLEVVSVWTWLWENFLASASFSFISWKGSMSCPLWSIPCRHCFGTCSRPNFFAASPSFEAGEVYQAWETVHSNSVKGDHNSLKVHTTKTLTL